MASVAPRQRRYWWAILPALVALVGLLLASQFQTIKEVYLAGLIYEAIKDKNPQELDRVIRRGANLSRIGAGGLMGGTPLVWAAESGDAACVRVIIGHGANVNQKIYLGSTALMCSSTPEVAKVLLNAGANPLLKDDSGNDALHYAKAMKRTDVASFLNQSMKIQSMAKPKLSPGRPSPSTSKSR